MSVTADIVQDLIDAGLGGQEILTVAKAMERGPDRDDIFALKDDLIAANCPKACVGIAIHQVALKIIERGPVRVLVVRDAHSEKRDSNKSRRGMSNEAWGRLRLEILERDNYTCTYCGRQDDLTCDHIIPLVRGGTNEHSNLTTACRPCNSSKGGKTLEEWLGYDQ